MQKESNEIAIQCKIRSEIKILYWSSDYIWYYFRSSMVFLSVKLLWVPAKVLNYYYIHSQCSVQFEIQLLNIASGIEWKTEGTANKFYCRISCWKDRLREYAWYVIYDKPTFPFHQKLVFSVQSPENEYRRDFPCAWKHFLI